MSQFGVSQKMRAVLLMFLLLLLSQAQLKWLGNPNIKQFAGSWYILATASQQKDFLVVKDTMTIKGVIVTFLPENKLKILFSQEGAKGCTLHVLELIKEDLKWIYKNPSQGILDYRMLATDFKEYAIIFTQFDFVGKTYNTLDLYSRTKEMSKDAIKQFLWWSKELGYQSKQQALLKKDDTCAHKIIH